MPIVKTITVNEINLYIIFQYIDPYTYYSSYYGDGYGPQVWSYVDCSGWEGDLHDCSKNVYPNTNCWHRSVAGVFCKDGEFAK